METYKSDIIRNIILDSLPEGKDILSRMKSSITEAQGKYLRARLCLIFAGIYSEPSDSAYSLAAAIELIHLASLLQDDVLDNEEKRRKRLAFHREWGKSMSILYSDVVFSKDTLDINATIYRAANREIKEELIISEIIERQHIGYIYDNFTKVDRVHFGIVEIWTIENPIILTREDSLIECELKPITKISQNFKILERWSELCAKHLLNNNHC